MRGFKIVVDKFKRGDSQAVSLRNSVRANFDRDCERGRSSEIRRSSTLSWQRCYCAQGLYLAWQQPQQREISQPPRRREISQPPRRPCSRCPCQTSSSWERAAGPSFWSAERYCCSSSASSCGTSAPAKWVEPRQPASNPLALWRRPGKYRLLHGFDRLFQRPLHPVSLALQRRISPKSSMQSKAAT